MILKMSKTRSSAAEIQVSLTSVLAFRLLKLRLSRNGSKIRIPIF